MRTEKEATGSLTLHLLDSAQGHPIQTWHFKDCARISIGRASDCDISLSDTQVSRLHVELIYRDDKWHLRSLGRNGTRIDGVAVEETRLTDRTIFQLGSSGPSFQFQVVNDSISYSATIDHIDPSELAFLVIDEQRKAEEVRQIAEGEVFRQLQQRARSLRNSEDTRAGDS